MKKNDWKPLQNLFNDDKKLDYFMFMGTAQAGKLFLYTYKHIFTRRYIYIDEKGNTYKFTSNDAMVYKEKDFRKIPHSQAIKYAYS